MTMANVDGFGAAIRRIETKFLANRGFYNRFSPLIACRTRVVGPKGNIVPSSCLADSIAFS
jgi:hypothetical protein